MDAPYVGRVVGDDKTVQAIGGGIEGAAGKRIIIIGRTLVVALDTAIKWWAASMFGASPTQGAGRC